MGTKDRKGKKEYKKTGKIPAKMKKSIDKPEWVLYNGTP